MSEYISGNVDDDIFQIVQEFLNIYNEIYPKLYKNVEDVKTEIIEKNALPMYGGEAIIQNDGKLIMIRDMLNLTIIVEDMMNRDLPSYQIRKMIDIERERLWSLIVNEV